MKIYLDDLREAPEGWHRCHTAIEVIAWLNTGRVEELSLDYDLGYGGCGEEVLKWLDERQGLIRLPQIHLHTMNPVGHERMQAYLERWQ